MSDRTPPKMDGGAVPDLDLPGSSLARRSQKMEAVKVPSAPVKISQAPPDLAPSVRVSAPPASSHSRQVSAAPPSSQRQPSAKPAASHSTNPAPGRSIAFDVPDDDDFDMEIERNTGGMQQPMATSTRPASSPSLGPERGSGAHHRVSSSALELGAPLRVSARQAPSHDSGAPGLGALLVGYLAATVVTGGVAAGLFKVMHHAGGVDLTRYLPHAFDGSSAPESGVVALASLGLAVAIGFFGLRLKPHAWAIVASGTAVLFLALAMVTVTLASTGENPTPPDGVLLVPVLLPAAVVLLALGVTGRAGRLFAKREGAARGLMLPIAAAAGALAFAAVEASRLVH